MSRYLNGELTAPERFVTSLISYLAMCGVQLSNDEAKSLHELRRTAQAHSGQAAAQIAYWTEQVELLRRALGEETLERRSLAEQLSQAETELDVLGGDLAAAVRRAQRAEGERDELQELTAEQQKQLAHAQRYILGLEGELGSAQEAVRLLRQEVSVLQNQVRRLLEGRQKIEIKVVRVDRLQRDPGLWNYLKDPWRAKRSPAYKKVHSALKELRGEFESACKQYGVIYDWDKAKAGREIAKVTGNAHWMTIGDNADHLATVGQDLYGSQDARHGEGHNVPPMTPTDMTASSFVAGVATVLMQIRSLRAVTVRDSASEA
ncbi:hypothetical protein [Streptomyces sp. NPDC059761]|uniref:hypothetical protein n=1 Tax=Streptomyces sp. NPDC059761 TaxID=3346937 RepID=UPI003647648B